MSRARKWARAIGIGIEAEFGTHVAPTVWIPGTSTLKTKPGFTELDNPVGVRGETRVGLGPEEHSGGLTLEVAPGAPTTTLLSLLDFVDGSTTHLKSASVYEMLGPTDGWLSSGLCANKFTLNIAKGENVTAELDCFAQQRRRFALVAGLVIPTIPLTAARPAPFVYKEFVATLDNADEVHLWTAKLEIDHMMKNDEYGSDGTGLVTGYPSDDLRVTVSLDHLYEHPDLHDAAIAGTEIAWELVLQRGTDLLTVTLPRTQIMEGQDPDEDDTKQSLQLKGLVPFSEAGPGDVYTIVPGTAGG